VKYRRRESNQYGGRRFGPASRSVTLVLWPAMCTTRLAGTYQTSQPARFARWQNSVSSKYRKKVSSRPPTRSNTSRRIIIDAPDTQSAGAALAPMRMGTHARASTRETSPSRTPCSISPSSDGKRNAIAHSLPSPFSNTPPAMPARGCDCRNATSAAIAPARSTVSGLSRCTKSTRPSRSSACSPRLLPYAKPPLRGATTTRAQSPQPLSAIAAATTGASPDALSTTTQRMRSVAPARSAAIERRQSTVSAADL